MPSFLISFKKAGFFTTISFLIDSIIDVIVDNSGDLLLSIVKSVGIGLTLGAVNHLKQWIIKRKQKEEADNGKTAESV